MKEIAEGKYFPFVAFHVICMYTVTAVMWFLQYILANIEAKKTKTWWLFKLTCHYQPIMIHY